MRNFVLSHEFQRTITIFNSICLSKIHIKYIIIAVTSDAETDRGRAARRNGKSEEKTYVLIIHTIEDRAEKIYYIHIST